MLSAMKALVQMNYAVFRIMNEILEITRYDILAVCLADLFKKLAFFQLSAVERTDIRAVVSSMCYPVTLIIRAAGRSVKKLVQFRSIGNIVDINRQLKLAAEPLRSLAACYAPRAEINVIFVIQT